MPAKFIKTYKYTAPDGMQFDTLDEEMIHELKADDLKVSEDMAHFLVSEREKIVAILNQRERKNASPKPRKPRKTAPVEAK